MRTIAGIPSGPLDLEVSSWRRVWQTFRVENLMGDIVNFEGVTAPNPCAKPSRLQIRQQRNLLAARHKQASQYAQDHPDMKPLAACQTMWLSRLKKWKFGKKWIGPYRISSQNGVSYVLVSNTGKSLVAHHNQLRLCPNPLDKARQSSPLQKPRELCLRNLKGLGGRRYIVLQRVMPDPHVFARS